MSARTRINWTDATWNPVVGCTKVSQGCKHCYAKTLHDRRHAAHLAGKRMAPQYAVPFEHVQFIDERLQAPLRWRRPRRIFVNSVSDLFHQQISHEARCAVFRVMAEAPHHTYQVLTKRPLELREFVARYIEERWHNADTFRAAFAHVHMGVSVESDAERDRILHLIATPFVVRWISAEPLLDYVDLARYAVPNEIHERCPLCAGRGWRRCTAVGCRCEGTPNECLGTRCSSPLHRAPIAWVVAGGESGRGARALDVDHARALRDECLAQGIPFWFKQVGGSLPSSGGRLLDGREWNGLPRDRCADEVETAHHA